MLLNERTDLNRLHSMIPSITHSGKGKTMETVKRSVVARSWGEEGMNRHSVGNF